MSTHLDSPPDDPTDHTESMDDHTFNHWLREWYDAQTLSSNEVVKDWINRQIDAAREANSGP